MGVKVVFLSLLTLAVAWSSAAAYGEPKPGPGAIQIYYYTTWTNAYEHYNSGKGWTPIPGVIMNKSTNSSYPAPQWKELTVVANALTFLFNDGNGNWDHGPDQGNFEIDGPGIYTVKDEVVTPIKKYAKVCPNECSGHGKCNQTTFDCKCDKGYFNPDCSGHCNAGEIVCEGVKGEYCYKGDKCPIEPLPGCETYDDTKCTGDDVNMNPTYTDRRWQTPARGHQYYMKSYQDYTVFVGNAHVEYSSDRKSATVWIRVIHKNPSGLTFKYEFGSVTQGEPSCKFDTKYDKPLTLKAFASDGATLELPDVDFIWNTHVPEINQTQGDYRNGQKGSIVEMFGWPDADIEEECDFVSKAGYLGVKLFPHHEQLMSDQPFQNELNPWYFMYQPVSYRLEGRMGTREDLRKLIKTCRSKNVRVYADAVINHMTGNGNDCWFHRNSDGGTCVYWSGKNTSCDAAPSPFFTSGFGYMESQYTNQPPGLEYPGVPYGPTDFHCERVLSDWDDPLELNAGWLVGLADINTERDNVRERIADYMTDLIGIGFSGFRVDAAKHVKPDDLAAIFAKLRRNLGGSLPVDFFTWLEVLIGGEHDLLLCNTDSGYNYAEYFANKLASVGISQTDINKIKIWSSWYPKETDADCGKIDKVRLVIQNDDHDQQEGGTSRDMGDKGSILVIDKDPAKHRSFEEILFNNPYGVDDNNNECPIRPLLSSYYFDSAENKVHAIPDGKSECSKCRKDCNTCENVPYAKAHKQDAKSYVGPVYTRTHRDQPIIDAMRKWMKLSAIDWANDPI